MPIPALALMSDADPHFTADRLVEQIRADWSEEMDTSDVTSTPTDDGFLIHHGTRIVGVAAVPESLQLDTDLLDFLTDNSVTWDEEAVPTDITEQRILFVTDPSRGEDDTAETVQDATDDFRLLTRVIASAVAISGSIRAVFHQTSNQITPPETYRAIATSEDWHALLKLWVAINLTEGPTGDLNAFTAGMNELGLPELELLDSKLPVIETYEIVDSIVEYLFENGPVIGDGDTVAADDVKLTATESPSVIDPEDVVMRLVFV